MSFLGHLVDQAQLVGSLSTECPAGDQQFPSDVGWQRAGGTEQGAGGGHETTACLREPERGRPRGDDRIARERDFQATAERDALHRRDDRGVALAADDAVLAAAFGAQIGTLGDIGAGAEDARGAGENTDPQVRIILEPVERGIDALRGRAVDRIAFGLALDADHQDVTAAFLDDAHADTPAVAIDLAHR